MCYALIFPNIDPVMLSVGPLKIHWYGVAYAVGIMLGWWYAIYLAERFKTSLNRQLIDDSIFWILGGIIIGGRLGHIVLYDPIHYIKAPWEIIMVWKGGMSFHGGLAGVLIALALYARKHSLVYLSLLDAFAASAPIGFFLGRMANFINGELFGRPTDVPWGMVFPNGGEWPRHPSQLYEAFCEGILLFLVLTYCWRFTRLPKTPGRLTGVGLLGYGLARIFCEFFREPELFGLMLGGITWGQVLSLPLVVSGLLLLCRSGR
jgi:phosphatidylglycerol:prolipoprotein diacylglycerol transferase